MATSVALNNKNIKNIKVAFDANWFECISLTFGVSYLVNISFFCRVSMETTTRPQQLSTFYTVGLLLDTCALLLGSNMVKHAYG